MVDLTKYVHRNNKVSKVHKTTKGAYYIGNNIL